MSWNHRVMKYKSKFGDEVYGITEVFYDEDDKPDGWAEPPQPVWADTREQLVGYVLSALGKPVLVPNEDETACTEEPALLGRAYADLCWEHDETVSDADVAAFDKVKALKLLNELAEKNEAERRSKENKQ